MEMDQIRLGIYTAAFLSAAGVFGVFLAVVYTYRPGKLLLRTYEEIRGSLKKSRNGLLDYEKTESFLRCNGADYHLGSWIGPVSYTGIRLFTALAGLACGVSFGAVPGLLLGAVGFKLPDMLLIWLNKKDNEELIPELKIIYNLVVMQVKAGVHIVDALSECYTGVKGKRLRRALYSLSGELAMNADPVEAMETLGSRFDNRYIDALCITVLQALESGQSVDVLSDIAEQIKDIEAALMSRKKSSLDRSITFYQLGILAAVLLVVLYACVTHLLTLALQF